MRSRNTRTDRLHQVLPEYSEKLPRGQLSGRPKKPFRTANAGGSAIPPSVINVVKQKGRAPAGHPPRDPPEDGHQPQ